MSFRYVRILLLLLALSCSKTALAKEAPEPVSPSRVLVVANSRSEDSISIAGYYMRRRKVPRTNLCKVTCPVTEECTMKEFRETMRDPVRQFIEKNKLDVDYIVLTKGFPIRTKEGSSGGFSTDSMLTALDWSLIEGKTRNPYFGKKERFSHKKYNLYLVTRLLGYSREDCLRLIDNSLVAKAMFGPFLLNVSPHHDNPNYRYGNDGIRRAEQNLTTRRFTVRFYAKEGFVGGRDLMGYYSWGSNDPRFNKEVYHTLSFEPGALAETVVSTSGRTFSDPEQKGQSLIADLVRQGVTGCKGYVSEPFLDAIAQADILFDRYTSGYSLAESFYAASAYIHWKDIVIGDPLCAPYARKNN